MIAEGDKVWFVPAGFPIAILCTVLEIDICGDLILDEPVGYDLDEVDIQLTKEEAADELIETIEAGTKLWKTEGFDMTLGELSPDGDFTLEAYRRELLNELEEVDRQRFSAVAWPEKQGDEVLTLNDARTLRGTPRSEFEELYGDD